MKIVSWNCNGALRKKTNQVDLLCADVLIIQECEDPSQSTKEYIEWAGDYLWIGTSKNKGIGVFPRNGNTIKQLEWKREFKLTGLNSNSKSLQWKTEDLNLFLPFIINNSYKILGVWNKGHESQIFEIYGTILEVPTNSSTGFER